MKAVANGSLPAQQAAATFALDVQDAVNLLAITVAFVKHLDAIRALPGVGGDELNNHPFVLAFISKLKSLCRMTDEREGKAFDLCYKIENREMVEYEVIP